MRKISLPGRRWAWVVRAVLLLAAACLVPACKKSRSSGAAGPAAVPQPGAAGTIQFSAAGYAGSEDGGAITITATRTGSSAGAVAVNYSTSDGTAAAGSDYTAGAGSLFWASGDAASKTFTVTPLGDAAVEGSETVTLSLTAASGGAALGAQGTAVLTITDNDAPAAGAFQFSAVDYTVNEGGASVLISVTRTGGSAGAVAVDFDTTNGTATAGADYTTATGTLNWAAGDGAAKTFTVPILNDAALESNEIVLLTLSAPTGGAVLGTTSGATATIVDNEAPGVFVFSAPSYAFSESGVSATVSVLRTQGSAGAVGVNYATRDNTARSGLDYVAAAGSLSWAAGDTAPKTFSVVLLNDLLAEGNETLDLLLSVPTGGATLGSPANVQMVLVDDDAALRFSASSTTVSEAAGTATITVSRVGGIGAPVGVTYATSNGTATSGADYTTSTGALAWAAGDGADKTFTVPILDDLLLEGDETVLLTLSAPTGGAALGTPGTAVLNILEDDPGFILSAATYTVNEASPSASITVRRIGLNSTTVSVTVATSDGTASAGLDYTGIATLLTWNPGDPADQTVLIPIINDVLVEGNETVNVALTAPTGGAQLGTPNTAVLTIVDNETSLQFTAAAYSVNEAAGTVTITVTRTGTSAGAVGVNFATADVTATAGSDYVFQSGTLQWADGDTAPKTFTLQILNDGNAEGNETLNLTLSGPTGGAQLGTPNTAVLTILDRAGVLEFVSNPFIVNEGGGTATISVRRTLGAGGPVSVNYATSNGIATSGADYGVSSGTLSWLDGDTSILSFTVPILEDTAIEGDETVNLTLSGPTGGATLGAGSTTLTIVDNDASLQFISATYSGREGTSVLVTVRRIGGTGSTFTVGYATTDGMATGADYTTATGTLTWPAASVNPDQTFLVPLTVDALTEGNETVNLTLSNPLATGTGSASLGVPSVAVLTILDGFGTLEFSSPTYSVSETGPTATIIVNRTGGNGGAVGVRYATSNGTATNADYTAATGTLSWADGDAVPKQFTIPITNDALAEGDETVNLTLSLPTGGAVIGATNPATLTIIDNDVALRFVSATYNVDEAAGNATITVRRVGSSVGAVGATFTTTNGSATAGSDYTTVTGTVSWADGITADQTFDVPVTNDLLLEANETVNLALSAPTGGAVLGAPSAAVLTIIDNDVTLQLSAATYTVSETAGTVTIRATRVGSAVGLVSVSYAVTPGTAATPANYLAGPDPLAGTLTWINGDTADKTFTFTIVDDGASNASRTVNLAITAPTGGAQLGTPNTAVLTITDAPGTLQFTAPTFAVGEAGPTASVTVSRTLGSGGAVSVRYATSDGTATAGADYAGGTGTLNWIDGDFADKTIVIPITDDALAEGDETVNLTLSLPTGGATIGAQSTAVLTITDNDVAFQFTSTTYNGTEGGTVIVTVNRVGTSVGAAGVTYTVTPGTGATTPADYGAGPDPLTGILSWIAADMAPKSFSFSLATDAVLDPGETVNVALSLPTAGGAGVTARLGTPSAAVVTIIDNTVLLQFSAATYSVVESNVAVITVTRVGASAPVVSVGYAVTPGTAATPPDYSVPAGVTGTLNFGSTVMTQTITITTTADDGVAEADKTVNLALNTPSANAGLGSPIAAVLTITDSPGTLRFKSAPYIVAETAGSFLVTVERVFGQGGAVTAPFATSNGTATQPADYAAASGVLSWANGDTADKTFLVTIVNDALGEGSETVILTLIGATGGATIAGTNPETLTITDNDSTLQLSAAGYRVMENAGTATFMVTRLGSSAGAVSVTYTVTPGTAATPADYAAGAEPLSGSVAWADGDSAAKPIRISIVNDGAAETSETVNVSLLVVTGSATLGAQTTAVLTIMDTGLDATAPTVIANFPTGVGVPTNTNLYVVFSEPMRASTINAATFNLTDGVTPILPATVTYDAASRTARLVPTAPLLASTLHTATVTTGALDVAGNPLVLAGWSFTTGAGTDAAGPTASSSAPTVDQSLATHRVIDFDESMDRASVEAATSLESGGTPVALAGPLQFYWNAASDQVTVVFDTVFPAGIMGDDLLQQNTTYDLIIATTATDMAGNALTGTFTDTFDTLDDATPPQVVSITPNPNAPLPAGTTVLLVTFNEPMNTGSGQAQISNNNVDFNDSIGGGGTGMTVSWDSSTVFRITLSSGLVANTVYELQINGLQDSPAGSFIPDGVRRVLVVAGSDLLAPTITARFPLGPPSTPFPRDSAIFVAFSEPMSPDLANHVSVSGGGSTQVVKRFNQDPSGVSLVPLSAWPAGATITVTVTSGARDASGNAFAGGSFAFTVSGADATAMEVDPLYSSIATGATNVDSTNGLGHFLKFRNSTSLRPAFLSAQALASGDISITESLTGIPVKGYTLVSSDRNGNLFIQPNSAAGLDPLASGTDYVLTLNPTLVNSRDIPIALTTILFTTDSGNPRPQLSDPPRTEASTTVAGKGLDLELSAQDASPLTVTATVSPDPGPAFGAALTGGGGSYNYNSSSEPNISTVGEHEFTYLVTDGTTPVTIRGRAWIFDSTLFPTLNAVGGPHATPTLSWSPVPGAAGADFLGLSVTGPGGQNYFTLLPLGSTSFTLPADQALPVAAGYTWSLILLRTEDGVFRDSTIQGSGMVTSGAFDVP